MLEVIERLADHQPSRAVVLCGEPEGDGIDARQHGLPGLRRSPAWPWRRWS